MVRETNKTELLRDTKKRAEELGWKLKSQTYKSAKENLHFVCNNGHTVAINRSNFVSGRRCKKCSISFRSNKKKQSTANKIQKTLSNYGLKLIEPYKGIKENHQFQCLRVQKHIFEANMDNLINRGRGCLLCKKPKKMGGVLNQNGNMITIKSGTFSNLHQDFISYEYSEFQITGNTSKHFKSKGYSHSINSIHWIKTQHLPRRSNKEILYKCIVCKSQGNRTISNIANTSLCGFQCSNQLIGDSLRKPVEEIEAQYDVKVLEYVNNHSPIRIKKNICGCELITVFQAIKTSGIPYCKHDSNQTWRTFETYVREAMNGLPGQYSHIEDAPKIDCITKKYAVEVKLSVKAISHSFGSRDPLLNIKKYKKWSDENDLNFYVIVNASQVEIDSIRPPLPEYILGWERWDEIGLDQQFIKISKDISKNPHMYRKRVTYEWGEGEIFLQRSSNGNRKILKIIHDNCKKHGYFTCSYLKKNTFKITQSRLAGILFGKNKNFTSENLCKAMNEIFNTNFENAHLTQNALQSLEKEFRTACQESGYFLSSAEFSDRFGISINGFMHKMIGKKRYSMKELRAKLGLENFPLKGQSQQAIMAEFIYCGKVYSQSKLCSHLSLPSNYINKVFSKKRFPTFILIPESDCWPSGHKHLFPEESLGKKIERRVKKK